MSTEILKRSLLINQFHLTHHLLVYALVTIWNNIKNNPGHPLAHLLPPQRTRILRPRSHNFVLPKIKTERFKKVFLNRCLYR